VTARIAIAVAAVSLSLPAIAQTPSGSIQGQVVDQNTGAPVRFANVALRGSFAQRILPREPAPPVPCPSWRP
jgi:hypothetical protein